MVERTENRAPSQKFVVAKLQVIDKLALILR